MSVVIISKVSNILDKNKISLLSILLAVLTGRFILEMSPLVIVGIIAVFLFITVVIHRIEIGILSIVFLVCSIIFEDAIPLIPLGIGSLHLTDIFLLFLMLLRLFTPLAERGSRFVKTPLAAPLILFYMASLISAFIAIVSFHVNFNLVTRELRILTYYLLFFPVLNLIRTKKQIEFLVKGLFAIALLVGIVMLLQAITGESIQLMPGRVEAVETFGRIYGATRILPPGQTLIYVMFITMICVISFTKASRLRLIHLCLVLIVLGAGVLLTYNRSYFVTILFLTVILMLLASGKVKKRLMVWFFTAIILTGMIIPLLTSVSGRGRDFVTSISDRIFSLSKGEDLFYSDSLELRKLEYLYALPRITQNPLFGIGLANRYRPALYGKDKGTTYTHNGYLWILLKTGIVGLIPFLWFYFAFLARVFFHWEIIEDAGLRSVVIGFGLSGIGILLCNIVNPMFMQWFSIVVIALMAGITESIIINRGDMAESDV